MAEKKKEEVVRHTKQFKEEVKRLVKRVTRPTALSSGVFNLQKNYPLSPMVGNEPLGSHNVAKTISYMGERIPAELLNLHDKPVNFILSNNHDLFKDPDVRDKLKTAKSRRRWYFVEDNQDEINIIMNIRDLKVGGADQREITSFLSLLHLLKKASYYQINPVVMGNNFFTKKEKERNHAERDKYDIFKDPEKFKKWQNSEIKVMFDYEENRPSSVDVLVQKLKDKLPKTEKKPLLFIGNDFSWRLTMFTLLLDDGKLEKLRKLYGDDQKHMELQFVGPKPKPTDLEVIEQTMAKRVIPDNTKGFVEKYSLLTLLNRDYGKNEKATKIYDEIFNRENYKRLGYTRLLYGIREPLDKSENYEKSNMAEPVDFWNPEHFDRSLLNDESVYISEMFERLIDVGHPILSIPYLIGELPADLSVKLIEENVIDSEMIAFIGKIGYILRESNKIHGNGLKQGQIVIPYNTQIAGENGDEPATYPIKYLVDEGDKTFFNYVGVDTLMTVAAVTVQENNDYITTTNKDGHLCVDMEQGYMAQRINSSSPSTNIVGGFYISDVSEESGVRRPGEDGKQMDISKPMNTIEGAIAASFTTLFAVHQIAKLKTLSHSLRTTDESMHALAKVLRVRT